MTGTSVVAIKYKDGILMVSDLGGQWKIFVLFFNIQLSVGSVMSMS